MANYEQNRGDRETEQLRKLFIGGLSPNVGEEELRQHFEQWGELVDVVVMKDRNSGRSRGFGFVTYKEEESVDRAQNNRPHVLDNKEVETKRAMPRGESTREESNMRVEKLFVGGLKPEVTEDQLREYFSSFGEVVSAEIATSRETGKPRGFAFVTFSDSDSVDKAILHKPHDIGSSLRVDCKKALSREQMAELKARQQQMQYGGYMGGRGGFMGGRGGFMGGRGGGFMGGRSGGYGGYGGGYGGYEDQGSGYGGGYDDGYGGYGGGYGGSGDGMYENGGGFGSYDNQGYGGGPSKGSGGFGGGPQRFQPYGGAARGGPVGGRGGARDSSRGMSGGFRGSRGGRGGYEY